MSLERKVIWYNIRTVNEPIYEDKLVKNMTMEICYEVTNTNPISIYILINVWIEGCNKYESCVHIDSGCSACFEKRSSFLEFTWERVKSHLQVKIVDNTIMSHYEAIEGSSIELGGVQRIIPVLWATDQPTYEMIIENIF